MTDKSWTHKPMEAHLETYARIVADAMAARLKDAMAGARAKGADSNEALSIGAACMATQLEVLVLHCAERGAQLMPGIPKESDGKVNDAIAHIVLADVYARYRALLP